MFLALLRILAALDHINRVLFLRVFVNQVLHAIAGPDSLEMVLQANADMSVGY